MACYSEESIMTELINELTHDDIDKLYVLLQIPEIIQERTNYESVDFVIELKKWKDFDGIKLIRALKDMNRPELVKQFQKLPWVSKQSKISQSKNVKSVNTLMELLISKMSSKNWKIIGSGMDAKVSGTFDVEQVSRDCLRKGLVTRDLDGLCRKLSDIRRDDLEFQVEEFRNEFNCISNEDFKIQIESFIEGQELMSHTELSCELRSHLFTQNRRVAVIVGKTEQTDFESLYTPLTIVEKVEMEEKMSAESSLTEIGLLRSMTKKEDFLKKIDFDKYLSKIDTDSPVSLCLIGHPGCGKTFLSKHTAYLYGTHQLNNFQFAIQIPCRSDKWHEMETSREKESKKVDIHFIQNWLLLGMPITTWSESLSKQLVKSGGESLLLILDGIDEFIKTVEFNTTLLCMLLQKHVLAKATVLFTSRPGAWSDLIEEHDDFIIDSEFQVLGFSPPNRDDYFRKRITDPEKQKQTFQLFFIHDEINQLSLVPVNASLFSALFNESANILSETLTRLYSELFTYMIRRQLYRMELRKLAKAKTFTNYHPSILECFREISKEAYWGIFHREMTSDKDTPITIDNTEYLTERLGLMQAHYKQGKLGCKDKVWVFAHLTLQEFMAAMYLCNKKWTEVCLVCRYIVSSDEVFSMFKMVIRFTCGWLAVQAGCLVPILCENLTPEPMPFKDIPMLHQLYYDSQVVGYSDWKELTETYCLFATMFFETNSPSVTEYFRYLTLLLPREKYLYFNGSVSPNEWHCFVNSLHSLESIQVLYINTSLIVPSQMQQLLENLSSCSLNYLALAFYNCDYSTVQSFTSLLGSATQFKVSLELAYCELSTLKESELLFPGNSTFSGSLSLRKTPLSEDIFINILNKFVSIEYLFIASKENEWSMIEKILKRNRSIKGLYLREMPTPSLPPVFLSTLPSLRELYWKIKLYFYDKILPSLQQNSNLSLLIDLNIDVPFNPNNRILLSSVISKNRKTLKQIFISNLTYSGFYSWDSILTPIQLCSNLAILGLYYCPVLTSDMNSWYEAISTLQSLVELRIGFCEFGDSEMWILCHSLTKHPALRYLEIYRCGLTSLSCEPLMMLIPTLPQLKVLGLWEEEVSSPDSDKLQVLKQTAEYFSVKISF